MSPRTRVLSVLAAGVLGATALQAGPAGAAAQPTLATRASTASTRANHKVIVLLKDQPSVVGRHTAAFRTRRSRIIANQAPVVAQLRSTSTNVRSYHLVNALAATVSSSEQAALRANPRVAAVIPDEVIHGPASTSPSAAPDGPTRSAPRGTCPSGSRPVLEPEALGVTHTQSDNRRARTARSLGYTGAGVKVAFMAEGIDVNNPDFVRADGSHVFVDYQDFSGDGTAAPTDAAEAFLDASAIAAQGRHTYDISHFSAVPLSRPCRIRVEGVAPGASLVGLKVFAENDATTTSGFLQAIDYAVNVDKVDVLNESFGGNPFPDNVTADAVAQFDEAAVAAGVTVTVSSGDAGPTNTIGSPATDPKVISVGGSTTFRFYAQTGYGGYYPLAHDGWLNDNISSLSSSGFSQGGRTIDMVAPGDLDFAVCTPDPVRYEGCTDFTGTPSAVEESGGTSESAPLTAGAAALVIQAYRHSHHGSSPTPALVKRLLTGTADDLGHPAAEQGAGRLNSYQAVLAAASVRTAQGSPARRGATVLTSRTQIDHVARPGTTVHSRITLTNNGSRTQRLALATRTLGPVIDTRAGSVALSDTTSRHFTDYAGQTTNYEVAHFTVPRHRARLDVDYVYPGDPSGGFNGRVRLALIDPRGRFAAHSLPQGVGNAGHVDVRFPASGTWTAMIWSRSSAVGGTQGTVHYRATTHDFRRSGSVSASRLVLRPGASRTVAITDRTPARPGDRADALVVRSSSGHRTSVPIGLRSLVDLRAGGRYAGVLTGGNGRSAYGGQTGYFQFSVPRGQRDLTANFRLANGDTDPVYGFLVDPAGNAQAYSSSVEVTGLDSGGSAVTAPSSTMSLFTRAPAAGRWTLILNFAPAVSGTVVSNPFSGSIQLNRVRVAARGLPDDAGTTLPAGRPVTVPVRVTNTGVAPESFFVDPRLDTRTTTTLANLSPGPYSLPLTPTSNEPYWFVPTETTALGATVTADRPVSFDLGWTFGFGDPDLAATSQGTTATVSYSASPVPSGFWSAVPAEIGPFGPSGAPPATANASLAATTLGFDPAVTTPLGDLEQTSVDPSTSFAVTTVAPGATTTIPVTITPSAAPGTVVSGTLFVDDLSLLTAAGELPSGQELAGLHYRYTVG